MTHDIIIVGGGIAGSALACALAQQTSLSIVILEAQTITLTWTESQYHHRVSAIALASQRIFQALGVWDSIKNKRVSPFTGIQVWDALSQADVEFDSKEIAESVLGFIIENNVIQSTLKEKLQHCPQVEFISSAKLVSMHENENNIELNTIDGQCFKAKLAIAADGAQSWLRQTAGIQLKAHDYEQKAIVATVKTEFPHQQIARQRFTETGPLAFLPLAEANTSSIVWSLPMEKAQQLMELDAGDFSKELASAFSNRLGKILEISQRFTFPLRKQQASQYIKSRVVLIGDAAHTIHPLAGQGANMGLLDAASLAEVITDALNRGRDFASNSNLRRYERWRKADNLTLMTGVDMIKDLFASDKAPINQLRTIGLNITNKIHWLKNIFTRHAVGNRSHLPKLAE